ncbi:MAG: hypothetical protein JWP73_231, partial [Phenylobacterium sp.]|nr:hypothetical protein [Phenylobacterium sp.]
MAPADVGLLILKRLLRGLAPLEFQLV